MVVCYCTSTGTVLNFLPCFSAGQLAWLVGVFFSERAQHEALFSQSRSIASLFVFYLKLFVRRTYSFEEGAVLLCGLKLRRRPFVTVIILVLYRLRKSNTTLSQGYPVYIRNDRQRPNINTASVLRSKAAASLRERDRDREIDVVTNGTLGST